jgi:hypothetical protein
MFPPSLIIVWRSFKSNPFEALLANMASHRWWITWQCVWHSKSQLRAVQKNGYIRRYGNSASLLINGVPGQKQSTLLFNSLVLKVDAGIQGPWYHHEHSTTMKSALPCPWGVPLSCSAKPIAMYILPHTTRVCHHHSFGLDEDIKVAGVNWIQQQPSKSCAGRIHQLVCQWDTSLNAHGVYF